MITSIEARVERDRDLVKLRVTILEGGKEHHIYQVILDDDFTSLFERIWEYVGREFLTRIRGSQKKGDY